MDTLEKRNYIEIDWSITDELGATTRLEKTIPLIDADYWCLDELIEEFKRYLIVCGYHKGLVDKIKYMEGGE